MRASPARTASTLEPGPSLRPPAARSAPASRTRLRPRVDERLLFAIGPPRSGSTLLARMIGAHSQVFAPAEPHLLTPLAHLGYYESVERAPYDPVISQAGIRELVAALPGGERDYLAALRAYADALYGRMLEASGRRLLLDKTPAYALVLDFVAT